MADNIPIKDAALTNTVMRTTDNAGVHTPHHIVELSALPAGASTEAKQPAFSTSGFASSDVVTVQGIAGMVPIDVTLPSIPAGSNVIGNVVIVGTVPLPSGASTEATLALIKAKTDNLDTALSTRTKPTDQQHVIIDASAAIATTGTFWQTTQPVSVAALPLPTGASTEATLATLSGKLPTTIGVNTSVASLSVVMASDQSTLPVSVVDASVLFRGCASTFRTPGRAGVVGQKLLSIHNATGSAVTVFINKIIVDVYSTVVKAVAVAPLIVRVWKITVLPTNGTLIAPVKIGGTSVSNTALTVRGDSSSDGVSSVSALTATLPAGSIIAQRYAPRLITASGVDPTDAIAFDYARPVVINPLEGLVVFLDYTVATMNPITDMWVATVEWTEV